MTTTMATQATTALNTWLNRLRFVLAVSLLWAGLHFIVGFALPRGVDRACVLAASPLAGLLAIVVLWLGAAAAVLITGTRDRRAPLIILGVALAIWLGEGGRAGGTMDDWLVFCNNLPGPPTGMPYWRLLADYVYLAVALAGAWVIITRLTGNVPARETPGDTVARAFALRAPAEERRQGVIALLTAVVVAAIAVYILAGPGLGATYRGQVDFAVGVGMFAGVFVAQQLVKTRDPLWYWPAPILLGVVGLIVAGMRPGFGLRGYVLNNLPAWGLSRPLPLEMVGAGLVGALWMLHAPSSDTARDAGR